ncbi:MAG: hypothetical protein P8H31_01220, partial [Porticoccaceae bacterium]|nr:hypothetical protein [Porticoccaceae bacterium]
MNSFLTGCKGFACRYLYTIAVSIFSTVFISISSIGTALANTDLDGDGSVTYSVFSDGAINPDWGYGLYSYLVYLHGETAAPYVRFCDTPLSANQADFQSELAIAPMYEYSSNPSCGVSEFPDEAGQLFRFSSATQLSAGQDLNHNIVGNGIIIGIQNSIDLTSFSNGVLRFEVLGLSTNLDSSISLHDNTDDAESGYSGNGVVFPFTMQGENESTVIEIDLQTWFSENINFDITQLDSITFSNFADLTLKKIEFIRPAQDASDVDQSGGEDGSSSNNPFSVPDFAGDWTLYQGAGAIGVGPSPGDISWWAANSADVYTRDCLFDDVFSFGSDGSFSIIQDGLTWVEVWQGSVDVDSCSSPVYPHDGSNPASYIYDAEAQTITLSGVGAYLGLSRVTNANELSESSEAPESITYNILDMSANEMTLVAPFSLGYWTFKLVRADENGSTDNGSGRTSSVEMIESFGGHLVDGNTFTYPSGAEVWGGFANMNVDIYPFTFANGGSISFTAAVPAGGTDTSVYFRFERLPHPDTDPSFNLDPVLISGAEQEYTLSIPVQDAGNTYESLLMYVVDQDSPVIVKNIVVTDDAEPDSDGSVSGTPASAAGYTAIPFGAGSVSDTINVASYRCVVDYGNWIYNAGVVEPGIDGCDGSSGVPSGTPTPLLPQITGEALNRPIPTHKWWGSVPFVGEMTVGDSSKAAYITPDPIRARISNKGARINGIPSGFKDFGNKFPRYEGPAPFDEVFEGVAIANSAYSNMDAYVADHSDGSVTVQWKSGATQVMDATFVHGSPYVY